MNGFVEQVTRDRAQNVVEILCYRLTHEPGALGLLVLAVVAGRSIGRTPARCRRSTGSGGPVAAAERRIARVTHSQPSTN